jgi:quinol-cytochrome oxidoreductase complex cytochrome b subunit
MTNTTTIPLIPFVLAFLVFVFRFYSRESASSIKNPSFMLAILTVLIAGSYLVLGVAASLPPYSTIGYIVVGLILLGTAVSRMFMI